MARAALFDADGTQFEGIVVYPVFDAFADEGFIDPDQNMQFHEILHAFESGQQPDFFTFVHDTLHKAAEILKGRKVATAREISEEFFAQPTFPWFGYVKPAIEQLHGADFETILVTAAPQFIAKAIVAVRGFGHAYHTNFGIASDGTFGGNVLTRVDQQEKNLISQAIASRVDYSVGFGDSEGDVGMLMHVNRAVCIRPDAPLRDFAMTNGWDIVEDPGVPIEDLLHGIEV